MATDKSKDTPKGERAANDPVTNASPLRQPGDKEQAPKEETGKSTAASCRRIATRLRAAAVWGHAGLAVAAKAFEEEALFLEPSSDKNISREDLQAKLVSARAALGAAGLVLDNPASTPDQIADAAKKIESVKTD